MKRTLSAKGFALLLCAATLFSYLAGCTDGNKPGPEDTAPVIAAPDRGVPDRTELAYLDAIEPYEKNDWTAQWIWSEGCSEDSYVLFRKVFTLEQDVASATAFISAVDKYVLWVNGELVVLDGSLKRGPTPYDSYYDTVELTNFSQGENVIAIQVAFNGRSGDGSIVPVLLSAEGDEYTQAGLLFEMQIGETFIVSDSSWRAARHNGYKNRVTAGADYPGYKMSSMLAERNVYFDAQDDMGDWNALTYDDSQWEYATAIAQAGDLPFGSLYDAMTDQILFGERIEFENADEYVGRELSEDTTLVLPLPNNTQFTFYFELSAPAGKTLTCYTDTYQYQEGLASFKDTYITKEGEQSYENYPWRSGAKLIIEAQAGVTFTKLGYRISQFNTERTDAFSSSDPRLDQLWLESQNTILVCMRDTFMDCPERERGPYMGDAANEVDAALYGFDSGALELIKRTILNATAWTPKDGGIPSRAPSVKPQEIPNQSLAFLTSAYHYWLHSGDVETMTAYYKASADYLKKFEMDNGLPVYRAGSWSWDDWGDRVDKELLQVGFYYYALNLTGRLGNELGILDDQAFFAERMTSIKEQFHDVYYTPDGFQSHNSRYIDERANAMLALSGLADEADYELIGRVIATTYQASPFCEKFVLEAACVIGRADVALTRMLDRYGPMLLDEYDTLWELFGREDGTVNHGWTSAPLYILSKYVAGIRPTAAGFEAYEIAPADVLDDLTCAVYTPKGELAVDISRSDGGAVIKVSAIAAEGIVRIPVSMGTDISVAGGTYELSGGNTIRLTDEAEYTITVQ